jgi:hypothetical protein
MRSNAKQNRDLLRRYVCMSLLSEARLTLASALTLNVGLVEVDDTSILLQEHAGEVRVKGVMTTEGPRHLRRPSISVRFVTGVAAESGFGPLLYEIAMRSVWLAPDRGHVSDDASNVWLRFSQRDDVHHVELPLEHSAHDDDYWLDRAYRLKNKIDVTALKTREWIDVDVAYEAGERYLGARIF